MAESRKRQNPKAADGFSHPKKRFDFSNLQGYRFLIPSKAAGSMIGKGGEVIKRLRSQFGCRIIVPDSEGPERMVIMDGEVDVVVDAWIDSLSSVKESINAKDCDYKNSGNKQIEDDNEIDVRLLVHESQAGAIIGKGGERIRNFIDSHKMTIIKLYPTLCPNSTDRIVRLVATPERLFECLRSMLKVLEGQIIKGAKIDYDPNNFDEALAPEYGGYLSKDSRFTQRKPAGFYPSDNQNEYVQRPGGFYPNDNQNEYVQRPGGYFPNDDQNDYKQRSNIFDRVSSVDESPSRQVFYGGSNARNTSNIASDLLDGVFRIGSDNDLQKHVSRVVLPIQLVSAVIGPDGYRLSEIKRDSGAQIQLDESRFSDREEMFLVRGTADQIYKAQCLMQLCARKYGDMGPFGY